MQRPVLAALLALAALPGPARAAEIKLATWNIAWLTTKPAGHPDLPRNVVPRAEADFAALRRYAARLDADVVAFQEVDGPLAAARVFDAAEYVLVFPDETDTQRAGFAVRRSLRVVRHPDLATLDVKAGARFSLRRGVDVTVSRGDGPGLRLLSVHLDSGCSTDSLTEPDTSDCVNLARQTAILADWTAERGREGAAFAILGDFNRRMTPGETMWRTLSAAAPLTRPTERLSNPCWGARAFIDHLLIGGPARDWLRPESLRVLTYAERDPAWKARLSDHCPVSVRLALPGAPAPAPTGETR